MHLRLLALVLVGALVLGALVLAWMDLPAGSPPDAVEPPARDGIEVAEPGAGLGPATAEASTPTPAPVRTGVASTTPPAPSARLVAERGRAALEVQVLDPGGSPLAGARVLVRSHTGPRPELYALEDDRGVERRLEADADGRARFPELPTGPYEVLAAAGSDAPSTAVRALLEEPATSVRVTLDGPQRNPGVVLVNVVGARNEPVAGARVELTGGMGDLRGGRAGASVVAQAATDGRGLARLADPGYHGFVIVAEAPDGRMGSATVWTRANVVRSARRGGIEVRVAAPASLEGTLTGLPAERLAGARVLARLLNNSFPHHTTHGRDFEAPVVEGRYALARLAAGTYTLSLWDPAGARLVLPTIEGWGRVMPNSVDPLEVELAAGTQTVHDLRVTAGATLEGRVLDEQGRPLAGALVRATITPRTSNVPDGFYLRGVNVWRFDSESGGADDHPETHRRATSDADGRYRLPGLHPGFQRVEVALPGRLYDRREEIELRDGETVRLEHVLVPAGAIQGIARAGGYLGVQREDEERPRMIAIVSREGLFCFPGLEPGTWTVAQFHSDARIEPVPLVSLEVAAGRTSWVDLDREGELPVRIAGRVLDGHGPVAGVKVLAWPRSTVTDAAGRFQVSSAFPWTRRVALTVEREGLSTQFEFPGMQHGDRRWEGELVLGQHELVVRAEDADGRPTKAALRIWLNRPAREEIERLSSAELAVDPTGELRLSWLPEGAYDVRATFPAGAEASAVLELPRSEALVLRAPEAGAVEVLVRRHDGTPAAGWDVTASTWTGEGPAPDDEQAFLESIAWRRSRTGPDGRTTLEGVRAGEVLVRSERLEMGWTIEPRPSASARLSLARDQRASVELTLRGP